MLKIVLWASSPATETCLTARHNGDDAGMVTMYDCLAMLRRQLGIQELYPMSNVCTPNTVSNAASQ